MMPPNRAGFAPQGASGETQGAGNTQSHAFCGSRLAAPGSRQPARGAPGSRRTRPRLGRAAGREAMKPHVLLVGANARYARPSAVPTSRTASATTHATPHCMAMTAHIIFVPSSFLTAETAATHGV